MPRPTDIASKATTESRRKGAYAANAKRRENNLSLRERVARELERRADELVAACVDAATADEIERLRDGVDHVIEVLDEGEGLAQARAYAKVLRCQGDRSAPGPYASSSRLLEWWEGILLPAR